MLGTGAGHESSALRFSLSLFPLPSSLPPSLALNSVTKQKEPFMAIGLEDKGGSGAQGKQGPWRKERGPRLGLDTGLFTAPAVLAVTGKAGRGDRAGPALAATCTSITGLPVPAE